MPLTICEMRLSEIIIIYLAMAAPFGVAHFQRRTDGSTTGPRLFLGSAGAALVWPLSALSFLFHLGVEARAAESHASEAGALREARIERAQRCVFDSLLRVEELLESANCQRSAETRHALFAARESVERFAGLTLAAAGAELNAPPTPRELELCRVSGRTGEDLLLSGRCLHRRNVIRLRLQRERARAEMLHALAEVRELAAGAALAAPAQAEAARRLSEAILNSYGHVINLLSLLEESRAALSVARLLDAECARLRKLWPDTAREDAGAEIGEEICTSLKAHRPPAPRPRRMTTRA